MQLQSALDIAGVSYQKRLIEHSLLISIYKTYLEDEGADETRAKAPSTPENSDEDSDDTDSGQDASDSQYFSADRLRRNIVNDPKIGCERSYSAAEIFKCVQGNVVYVSIFKCVQGNVVYVCISCNKHRTCFDCAT
jgi:hypothetical protein